MCVRDQLHDVNNHFNVFYYLIVYVLPVKVRECVCVCVSLVIYKCICVEVIVCMY